MALHCPCTPPLNRLIKMMKVFLSEAKLILTIAVSSVSFYGNTSKHHLATWELDVLLSSTTKPKLRNKNIKNVDKNFCVLWWKFANSLLWKRRVLFMRSAHRAERPRIVFHIHSPCSIHTAVTHTHTHTHGCITHRKPWSVENISGETSVFREQTDCKPSNTTAMYLRFSH